MSDIERDYAIRSALSSLALSGIEVPREQTERIYDELERSERVMAVYVPAAEAYDAALRALYPPPVIITTDRTEAP